MWSCVNLCAVMDVNAEYAHMCVDLMIFIFTIRFNESAMNFHEL